MDNEDMDFKRKKHKAEVEDQQQNILEDHPNFLETSPEEYPVLGMESPLKLKKPQSTPLKVEQGSTQLKQEEGSTCNLAENDEIVREIDVFLNSSIDSNTKLYLLQYPLRPKWRPYDLDEKCEEVRVKPKTSEVEIDLKVETDSENYNSNAAPGVKMTKQTLATAWEPTPSFVRYAIGVLVGNKLHLNPIHEVVQLRPSMRHLGLSEHVETRTEEEQPPSPSSDHQAELLKATQDKDPEESWVHLKFHPRQSDISKRYLGKMVEVADASPILFDMSPYDYLKAVCSGGLSESEQDKEKSKLFEGSQVD